MCMYTYVSVYRHACVLMSVCADIYICICVCAYLQRSVYVIQGVKDSKILCWLYSVMLLS